jgi:hypothetical protein
MDINLGTTCSNDICISPLVFSQFVFLGGERVKHMDRVSHNKIKMEVLPHGLTAASLQALGSTSAPISAYPPAYTAAAASLLTNDADPLVLIRSSQKPYSAYRAAGTEYLSALPAVMPSPEQPKVY